MKRSAALALVVMALLVPARRASAAMGATAAAAAVTPVDLLAQTPWVKSKGDFQLRVSLNGLAPSDQVAVTVYDLIGTRTDFELAAKGTVEEYTLYHQTAPASALPADPAGGVDIDLPVNQPPAAGAPFPEVQILGEENGVHAVQVQLVGAPGPPLTTFLTFSQGTAKEQGFSPLATAVVVPYESAPVVSAQGELQPPGAAEAKRLQRLADALNDDNSVPISLQVSPVTLAALKAGEQLSPVDRDAIGNISGAPAGDLMQVLPTTWSPVSIGDLTASGLSSEVDAQLNVAGDDLHNLLGYRPDPQTWAIDGPLDDATLEAMAARGASQFILPDTDLTAPSQISNTTFVHASQLGSGSRSVFAADPGLSADFVRATSPVLAGNILLADMAMVFTEAPGDTGAGIVAMPPPGSVVDPALIDTVLAGLAGDPLLNPVTAAKLFSVAGRTDGTRYLAAPNPPQSSGASAFAALKSDITNARAKISEMTAVLPAQAEQSSGLEAQLLLAESETLTPPQRAAVLAAIKVSTDVLDAAVTLPPPTSITLTSTQGQIPITILAAPNLHPTVELRLTSNRLIFHLFKPPDGTCTLPTPQEEDCVLSLKNQNTTLKVPVETRSSGVFPLDVTLTPPGSPLTVLHHEQDTVRSTAVSTVAIVLIVMALAGLAYWWVRDIRRGRRPKGMLPTPGGSEAGPDDDYFEEFFRQPPPTYGGPMSPSARSAGPTTTDRYGSGRETRE